MSDDLKNKFKQALAENADSEQTKIEKHSLPKSIFIIPGIVLGIILLSTYLFSPYADVGPQGKIESPPPGFVTGKEVKVIGETKRIEPGQHVWIAVDKPEIGLCWPKMHIAANTKFKTTILEEGPKELFTLSIYILNENHHKQWKEWQGKKIFGGLHLPPKSKRLDSVEMILNE